MGIVIYKHEAITMNLLTSQEAATYHPQKQNPKIGEVEIAPSDILTRSKQHAAFKGHNKSQIECDKRAGDSEGCGGVAKFLSFAAKGGGKRGKSKQT